jgi:hypothetical protein
VTCSTSDTEITAIKLQENRLIGTLPDSLSALTGVTQLWLRNNQLSGTVPDSLSALSRLEGLSLADNHLSGSMPGWLSTRTALSYLALGNNQFGGSIPDLRALTGLANLFLVNNQLSGTLPGWLSALTALTDLRLQNNMFDGVVPELPFTQYNRSCDLRHNAFACPLPADANLCQPGPPTCTSPTTTSAPTTTAAPTTTVSPTTTTTAPPTTTSAPTGLCTGASASLAPLECSVWQQLYIATNGEQWAACREKQADPCACKVSEGAVDVEVTCDSGHITRLNMNGNQMEGTLPVDLGMLAELAYFSVSGNLLQGTLPPELGQLNKLTVLCAAGNEISGELPGNFTQLRVLETLALKMNVLTGSLPAEWTSENQALAALAMLDVSSNRLSGSLPNDIDQLAALQRLDMTANLCNGTIPNAIARLAKLTSLNLGDNGFAGTVPNLPYSQYLGAGSCNLIQRVGTEPFQCPPSGMPDGFETCKFSLEGTADCVGSTITTFTLDLNLTGVVVDVAEFESTKGAFEDALQSSWNGVIRLASHPVRNITVAKFTPTASTIRTMNINSGVVIVLDIEADAASIGAIWDSLGNTTGVPDTPFAQAFVDVANDNDFGFPDNVTISNLLSAKQSCPSCQECPPGGSPVLYSDLHCGATRDPSRGFCLWDATPECSSIVGHIGRSTCNTCECNPGFGPGDRGCPVRAVLPDAVQDVLQIVAVVSAILGFFSAVYKAREICITRLRRRYDKGLDFDCRDRCTMSILCGSLEREQRWQQDRQRQEPEREPPTDNWGYRPRPRGIRYDRDAAAERLHWDSQGGQGERQGARQEHEDEDEGDSEGCSCCSSGSKKRDREQLQGGRGGGQATRGLPRTEEYGRARNDDSYDMF